VKIRVAEREIEIRERLTEESVRLDMDMNGWVEPLFISKSSTQYPLSLTNQSRIESTLSSDLDSFLQSILSQVYLN